MGEVELAKTPATVLIQMIEDSRVPLGEEEERLSVIRRKVEQGTTLTREEETFLRKLADKANEWQKGLESSEDTEPEDTLSG